MNDAPKMWIGTPDGDDWRKIGEVKDLDVNLTYDPPNVKETGIFDAVTPVQDSYVVETKLTSNVDSVLEFARKYISAVTPEQEQFYRSVMVVGTRKVEHAKPAQRGTWFRRGMPELYATVYGATKRVEHARARKLYSERLRRDRRRQRKGRAPILRSGPDVRTLFPRVKVDEATRRGDIIGMQMVASPHLDTGQVAVFDTQLLDRAMQERPILQYEEPLKDVARDYIRGYSATLFAFDETRKFTRLDPS